MRWYVMLDVELTAKTEAEAVALGDALCELVMTHAGVVSADRGGVEKDNPR